MAKDTEVSDTMSSMTKAGMERVREGMEKLFRFFEKDHFGVSVRRHGVGRKAKEPC